ncbi:DUF29 domain-containing protein [Methylobacterium sp. HMF5984]|uniref:DUF29 domain-containing protein n=1 Tax=Methylobacterium sp. HMF5984 TaxID=3367370 RepID=UPI0038523ACE
MAQAASTADAAYAAMQGDGGWSSSHPFPHPEAPQRSGGLEGALQRSRRVLEGSFEAADAAPQDEVVGGIEPSAITPAAASGRTRYEDDRYTWVGEQIALLRAGKVADLDLDNIAEELEDVAMRLDDQLVACLRVLLMQMLIWDQRSERRNLNHVNTIVQQRLRMEYLFRDSPRLRSRLVEASTEAYRDAAMWGADEAHMPESDLTDTQPYSADDILNRPFELDADR